ncbi:MAG: hypothetical protein GF309_13245 [Candidatus Lokiarchaeota archaeon]|nr:hypothetical protein [Candidatus Lokiarchaeota archaeon]
MRILANSLTLEGIFNRLIMNIALGCISMGGNNNTITANYLTTNGTEKEQRFSKDTKWVNLSSEFIRSIDLSFVSSLDELERLSLDCNYLRKVDLTPIAACNDLKELWLNQNSLRKLDFSPLAGCNKLKRVELYGNNLEELDLSGLRSCTKLEVLTLNKNQLKYLDLSPLSSCTHLYTLDLGLNNLYQLEVSPLAFSKRLHYVDLSENQQNQVASTILSRHTLEEILQFGNPPRFPKNSYSRHDPTLFVDHNVPLPFQKISLIRWLAPIVQKYEPNSWKITHLVQCLVNIVCPNIVGLLDIGFNIFQSILNESDTMNMRNRLFEAFNTQVAKGETTIGFDIEKVFENNTIELTEIIPHVIRLRKSEMDSLDGNIPHLADTVDLTALWLTAYGHKILSNHGAGLECSIDDFEIISKIFETIGISLQPTDKEQYIMTETSMSDSLKQYITVLANKRMT